MSAMSASSGLMPISLISEHKSAQGGPPAVQPLSFATDKHSIVQAPKPTPNGMEPPSTSVIPAHLESNPNFSSGGAAEPVNLEEKSGTGSAAVSQGDLIQDTPSNLLNIPNTPHVTEAVPVPASVSDTTSSNSHPTPSIPNQQVAPSFSSAVRDCQSLPSPLSQSVVNASQPVPSQAQSVEANSIKPEAQSVVGQESVALSPLENVIKSLKEESNSLKTSTDPKAPVEKTLPSTEKVRADPSPNFATAPLPTPVSSKIGKSENVQPSCPSTGQPGRPPKRVKNTNSGTVKKNTNSNSPMVENTASLQVESSSDKRTKRKRLPTQVYQSPIPELNIIAKMSKHEKPIDKAPEDRLIVFYRNEFLAVRNEEGSYYVCQTMQNVYKSSSKIRIRWLSQQENTDYYSPDFYDNTEFDCILTNLNLERIEKNKYRLPDVEAQRTESILKRAINVQKGIAPPEEAAVTEEHPDGLDLSLYRNEEQLKRRKGNVRNKISKLKGRPVKQSNANKKSRLSIKRKPIVEVSKTNSSIPALKRISRESGKVEKSVVQLIVEAKKMGRRKTISSPVTTKTVSAAPTAVKESGKKKEVSKPPPPPPHPQKRKITEPQPAPIPDKKAKTGTASKTRNL